jgi:hypothetical protein
MSPALHRARGAQTVPPYIQCGEMPSRNKVIAGILFSLYFRTRGCNSARCTSPRPIPTDLPSRLPGRQPGPMSQLGGIPIPVTSTGQCSKALSYLKTRVASGRPTTPASLTTKSRGSCTRRRVAISLPNHLMSSWSKRASRWFNQRVSDTAVIRPCRCRQSTAHHHPIDQDRSDLEVVHGFDDQRIPGRPVMTVTGQQADADGIAARHQTKPSCLIS